MTIGKLEHCSAPLAEPLAEYKVEPCAASQGDADWFSAALQKAEPVSAPGVFSEQVMAPLARKAMSLEDLSKNAGKALRDASHNTDPATAMAASRALSAYYLQSSLSVKVVSKGVQALDKLTTLQ